MVNTRDETLHLRTYAPADGEAMKALLFFIPGYDECEGRVGGDCCMDHLRGAGLIHPIFTHLGDWDDGRACFPVEPKFAVFFVVLFINDGGASTGSREGNARWSGYEVPLAATTHVLRLIQLSHHRSAANGNTGTVATSTPPLR